MTQGSPDLDTQTGPVRRRTESEVSFRVQQSPDAVACVVPTGGIGIAVDRLRLLDTYGERCRLALATVGRVLPEFRRAPPSLGSDRVSVFADLAPLRGLVHRRCRWLGLVHPVYRDLVTGVVLAEVRATAPRRR